MVLNWPTLRSGGVFRLRDATVRSRVPGDGNISPWCVPGRQTVASFALHVSQKVPRTGKAPLHGKIRAPCIRKRAPFGKICAPCIRKALQTAVWEYTARRSCHEGVFSLHRPLESCTTRESCHSWVFRLGVAGGARGAGAAHAARARPPALCEAARCFRGFISCSFELSPLTRTMLLLLRLLSRETRSLPPPA